MDPVIRQRFVDGGIRIVRNYAGPSGGSKLDLWKLKRWDEMFLTTDKSAVGRSAASRASSRSGPRTTGCASSARSPCTAIIRSAESACGYNHTATFHLSAAPGEYARIHALRPTLKNWGLLQFARDGRAAARDARLRRAVDALHVRRRNRDPRRRHGARPRAHVAAPGDQSRGGSATSWRSTTTRSRTDAFPTPVRARSPSAGADYRRPVTPGALCARNSSSSMLQVVRRDVVKQVSMPSARAQQLAHLLVRLDQLERDAALVEAVVQVAEYARPRGRPAVTTTDRRSPGGARRRGGRRAPAAAPSRCRR